MASAPPKPDSSTAGVNGQAVEDWDLDSLDDGELLALVDDNFGLSSSDEEELLELAVGAEESRGTKRKTSPLSDSRPSKVQARDPTHRLFGLAETILQKSFGIKSFRLKQAQAIDRLLNGDSAVVVFPTGGGKSLCYQLPALAFSEIDKLDHVRQAEGSGITLVVSPLIALMKDQTDALTRRGINAATMDSTKSREEYLRTCDMMHNGELKILYVAPERLNNEGFISQIANVRGGVRLVAVDEAHCISEWGHAFRPDYLKVARFVKEIKAERVVCLTATATDRVAKDICKAFDVPNDGLFRTTTYRPNLRLLAESARTKQDLYPQLFNFLKTKPGSTIIYVTLQKQTEQLTRDLIDEGFEAKAFHAGMAAPEKVRIQEEFMINDKLIIVATIAFGMGIDKASIRNVIHFNIPSSLESYSQEIGRAGRDGLESNCMFYVCSEDLHLREMFARGDLPARKSVVDLLKEIFEMPMGAKYAIGDNMEISHGVQEKEYDIRATTLKNIYAQLELRYGLIRATTPKYTKYTFKPGSTYHSTIANDTSSEVVAIKTFVKQNRVWWTIDIDAAASRFNLPRQNIIARLQQWNEGRIIELQVSGVLNIYRIMKPFPATATEIESITDELYHIMQGREQQALKRTEQVLDLIKGRECFSLALARHFGDILPDGKSECGHCTWCLSHQAVTIHKFLPEPLDNDRLNTILAAVEDRDDPRFLARIAFGITSPRVTAKKLSRNPIFASMDDHSFMQLLRAFEKVCDKKS